MILKLSPKEKYESIVGFIFYLSISIILQGMEIRVKTIDGKIFDGQVDAFNIAQVSDPYKN